MADDTIPRRRFLLSAGIAGTAVATGLATDRARTWPSEAQTPPVPPAPASSAPTTASAEPEILLALTATEAAFVSAAVDAFIPTDDLSPSGPDCGIVTFIDRQL